MAKTLASLGIYIDVATTDDDGPGGRLRVPLGERVEQDGFGTFYFKKQTEFYKISRPLTKWLSQHVREYDLVHIHALFSFSSNCAAWAARRAAIPYIIRPLGVLNDWGVQSRRPLLKKLSLMFVDAPVLRHAAAMHYTSEQERLEAERNGATARGVVIPLQIDTKQFDQLPVSNMFFKKYPAAIGKKVLLFLSRLDPKKGLECLLPAYAEARKRFPATILVVAGSGSADYEASLKTAAARLGLEKDVLWTGFISGEDKMAVLSAADLFVMPSKSENFGIALVEAMACGKSCIVTPDVGIAHLINQHEAGLVVPHSESELSAGICRLLADQVLRERFGANARLLVGREFSGEAIGRKLVDLYQTIAMPQRGMRSQRPVYA